MSQINLNVTPDFERDLKLYMRKKKIRQKSQAIREAIKEAVENTKKQTHVDYRNWRGMGLKTPLNSKPRFEKDEDLW